ncbi:glycosyltransferase family 2 protein [Urechidicola vernalis]|uniref:Glycosyltransferase family 2 protein n=1 Tax=Urechidicola vernalis TaxID=3075600 RepID=A0ABU2Y6Q6_9FLAO|nr:glycosyltransferase family 2 protein [Urechidicola sp. P050]MDT0553884.1 glycosyltransferase family 2 protein [Urechidicola sp. P050]
MNLAIVILNWNGAKLLQQFLPSIIKHSPKGIADIYVVDNNSSDNSISILKENFPQVHIVQNEINGGFAKGYNDGLKQIDADYYALVNSDIEVSKNWLQPILAHFKTHPNTAIIQPKILDFKNKSKFEYAGAAGGLLDKFGYPYCRGRIFDTIEEDYNQYHDATIFWASGACFFVKAEIYKELNGFDENYFAHYEEIDLCWRIQNLNFNIDFVSKSTVYHVGGATLNKLSPKKTYLNFRNSLLTLVKNAPKKGLFLITITRMVLDGIAGLKFLFNLKPRHTFAILKAHVSFYLHLNEYLKLRKDIASKKRGYFHTKSIVWSYYIKGKKTFSKLTK